LEEPARTSGYNATDGTNNFDKVVDFLGTMAEAESFKVSRLTVTSSASGIFHFLTGNGGGHNKAGVKRT
jgi:adenine C2-methylase RlmN of 23S rRNA A2503 and tRNA A37